MENYSIFFFPYSTHRYTKIIMSAGSAWSIVLTIDYNITTSDYLKYAESLQIDSQNQDITSMLPEWHNDVKYQG